MDERKLKDIYNMEPIPENGTSLVEWHNEVIEKTPSELTDLDFGRMIRQNIFVDTAFNLGVDFLLKDPFCGELWTGETLEKIITLDEKMLKTREGDLKEVVKKAKRNINSFAWADPEEKEEYLEWLSKLEKILKKK